MEQWSDHYCRTGAVVHEWGNEIRDQCHANERTSYYRHHSATCLEMLAAHPALACRMTGERMQRQ